MMKRLLVTVVAVLAVATISLQAQTTVSGVVTDAELGDPLIGANVIITGTTVGASTDLDGNFSITSDTPLPWDLEISYTGFAQQNVTVTSAQSGMAIALQPSALIGQEVVVSASRRREKIQEAPASISVFNARKLEASPQENPVRNLISAPGVTIQQQSAGRINIQLRGDGGLFGSASFPIMDYRSLAGPGLGTFDALNSPLNNLDIDRIEVVRGPGSALYGPGVTTGVVHFITKSPIDKPGTSLELMGGELGTYGITARHATKVSDKFGFKVNAVYKKGGEFTLDNEEDADQIAKFQKQVQAPGISNGIVDATVPGRILLTESDLDPDGDGNVMQDFWEQFSATATLEFRPQDDLSVNVAGGVNSASAVFYNSQGEGLTQATEAWAQARMQKGGLFAQAFVLTNNGGTDDKPTFLYQTGNSTGISRTQLEAQVQYNFDTPNFLNANWTAGIDYRNSIADTGNEVYGRNEEDDDFGIIGAYIQGKFALGDKLDLVLAGRGDRFNFTDENAFSPRAVLVYKPSPKHTFRFGYNRAIGAPSQLIVNIDFPVSSPVPGAFDIWLRGNKEAQTFDNAVIDINNALPFPDLPIGTPGWPNAYTYGAVAQPVLEALIPGIAASLQGQGATAEQAAAAAALAQAYLADPANAPGGFTGAWTGINIFNGEPLGLSAAPQAVLRKEDTWEFGYKGLLGDKLGVTLDVYNRKIDGNTLFTGISPAWIPVGAQFGADLGASVATPEFRQFLFDNLGGAANPVAGATADGIVAATNAAFTAGGDNFAASIAPLLNGAILATTPSDQVPQNGVTHLSAGYRTFDAYDYTGVDFGLEYYANQDLSFFANYSYISDNVFEDVPIRGGDGATETTTVGAPQNKFRFGGNYTPATGLRANLSVQYDESYLALIGQFSGQTGSRTLVDLGVGYKFNDTVTFNVSAQNALNNRYRPYPLFPEIGRRVLATLVLNFGGDK
ncbi:MAG: TonB-dependent receptor [Bacteroidota bacterium]